MNRRFSSLLALMLLIGSPVWAGSGGGTTIQSVTCTGIRDEPGAPTYAFELRRKDRKTYTARYLTLPGNEKDPPVVVAEITALACRFLPGNAYYFQCEKLGASIESFEIIERKLSLIADKIQVDRFREFRATGILVPEAYLVYRFGSADTCKVRRT